MADSTEEELNEKKLELEYLMYVLSHDLQEPLRGISNNLSLLEMRYANALSSSAYGLVSKAKDGALQAQRFVGDLLIFSRLQGELPQTLNYNLRTLIAKAEEKIKDELRQCDGGLVIEPDLPDVRCHPDIFSHVFQNLFTNAIRHCEEVPRIKVSIEDEAVDAVTVVVQDNGVGISPETQGIMWAPFKRGAEVFAKGTGLGLSICKRIVEGHGGEMGCDSVEGKGSAFWFTISRAKE